MQTFLLSARHSVLLVFLHELQLHESLGQQSQISSHQHTDPRLPNCTVCVGHDCLVGLWMKHQD